MFGRLIMTCPFESNARTSNCGYNEDGKILGKVSIVETETSCIYVHKIENNKKMSCFKKILYNNRMLGDMLIVFGVIFGLLCIILGLLFLWQSVRSRRYNDQQIQLFHQQKYLPDLSIQDN